MLNAPLRSYYVWIAQDISYPLALAAHLGRDDLVIISPYMFRSGHTVGRTEKTVVDHAYERQPFDDISFSHSLLSSGSV
jgi:hypothetical protein